MAYSQNRYKRTVRCSYCHQSGHNKSSCPKYAARIEEIRKVNAPDHYAVVAYDAKKAKRKASGKERSCSYCDNKGHNRWTCPELKANIANRQAKNVAVRKTIYERMKAHGFGVGAIISSDRFMGRVDPNDWDSQRYRIPQVVVQVNWNHISHFNREYTYFDKNAPWLTKPLTNITYPWTSECGWFWDNEVVKRLMSPEVAQQYIDGTHWRANSKMQYFCEVTSPIKTEEPPEGWFEGGDVKFWKKAYKKYKSWAGAL